MPLEFLESVRPSSRHRRQPLTCPCADCGGLPIAPHDLTLRERHGITHPVAPVTSHGANRAGLKSGQMGLLAPVQHQNQFIHL